LAAQDIHGVVVDEGTMAEISGALVELFGADGERIQAQVSSAAGTFVFLSDAPGVYRLRVERIGYTTWTSDEFHLGTTPMWMRLEIAIDPVELPEINVSSATTCPGTIEDHLAARALYDRVISALEPLVWAEDRSLLVFQVEVTESGPERAPGGQRLTVELLQRLPPLDRPRLDPRRPGDPDAYVVLPAPPDTLMLRRPIISADPRILGQVGYVQPWSGIGLRYFPPTASSVLSVGFRSTHCFQVRENPEETWTGLAFTPLPSRDVPDVEGVIWLGEDGGAREIEFAFTRLEQVLEEYEMPIIREHLRERVRGVPRMDGARVLLSGVDMKGAFGGRLRFEKLDAGWWITREWEMRIPVLWYSVTWEYGSSPKITGNAIAMERVRHGTVMAVLAPQEVADSLSRSR